MDPPLQYMGINCIFIVVGEWNLTFQLTPVLIST